MSKERTRRQAEHPAATKDAPIADRVLPKVDGVPLKPVSRGTRPARSFRASSVVVLIGAAATIVTLSSTSLLRKWGLGNVPATPVIIQARADGTNQPSTPPATPTSTRMPTPTTSPSPAPTADPALTLAEQGVESNSDWASYIRAFDHVEMALVPAGCFMMGGVGVYANETPIHDLCFETPFWIDLSEVSNKQYGAAGYFVGDGLPRETVSWFEAAAFCELRGARLPTEAEWEYAARGPDGLLYPWGVRFAGGSTAYRNNSDGHTQDTGGRPDGRSWVGALDMSGNVEEWVSSLYQPYPYVAKDGREATGDVDHINARVVRGGSWWTVYPLDLRAAARHGSVPTNVSNHVGFRCARWYGE